MSEDRPFHLEEAAADLATVQPKTVLILKFCFLCKKVWDVKPGRGVLNGCGSQCSWGLLTTIGEEQFF